MSLLHNDDEPTPIFYHKEDYEDAKKASYIVGFVSGALIASGLWVLGLISIGYFISN